MDETLQEWRLGGVTASIGSTRSDGRPPRHELPARVWRRGAHGRGFVGRGRRVEVRGRPGGTLSRAREDAALG